MKQIILKMLHCKASDKARAILRRKLVTVGAHKEKLGEHQLQHPGALVFFENKKSINRRTLRALWELPVTQIKGMVKRVFNSRSWQ